MKIELGHIVEATEVELMEYYLTRGWDDIMSFPDFLERMKASGCKVNEYSDEDLKNYEKSI